MYSFYLNFTVQYKKQVCILKKSEELNVSWKKGYKLWNFAYFPYLYNLAGASYRKECLKLRSRLHWMISLHYKPN